MTQENQKRRRGRPPKNMNTEPKQPQFSNILTKTGKENDASPPQLLVGNQVVEPKTPPQPSSINIPGVSLMQAPGIPLSLQGTTNAPSVEDIFPGFVESHEKPGVIKGNPNDPPRLYGGPPNAIPQNQGYYVTPTPASPAQAEYYNIALPSAPPNQAGYYNIALPTQTVPQIQSVSENKQVEFKQPPIKYKIDSLEKARDFILPFKSSELVLGLAIYKDVTPATFEAALETVRIAGDRMSLITHCGDAIIENARNHIADKFMANPDSEWLLFLDDDVVPPFGKPERTRQLCRLPKDYKEPNIFWVDELLRAGKTLIGGLYFGRSVEGRPMYAEACFDNAFQENVIARSPDIAAVRPSDWVATGCMLIHRSVFEDIQKNLPALAPGPKKYSIPKFDSSGNASGTEVVVYNQEFWGYFNKIQPQGEDVSFCHRAAVAGHQPHIHLGVKCQHIGRQAWNYSNAKAGLIEYENY